MGGIVASYMATQDMKRVITGVVLLGPVHPNPGTAEVFRKRIETVRERMIVYFNIFFPFPYFFLDSYI